MKMSILTRVILTKQEELDCLQKSVSDFKSHFLFGFVGNVLYHNSDIVYIVDYMKNRIIFLKNRNGSLKTELFDNFELMENEIETIKKDTEKSGMNVIEVIARGL